MEAKQIQQRIHIISYRLRQWKNHLLPPVMSAMLIVYPYTTSSAETISKGLFWISSLICISIYGYWVNDWADRQSDVLARKPNFLAGLPNWILISGALLFSLLAIILWLSGLPHWFTTSLFILEWVLFTLYCIPIIRLKNRPIWGPLCDAHYTHIVPVFFTLFYFQPAQYHHIWIIIYLVLLCKGLRNILLHQIEDRKADTIAGIKSFPITMGPITTLRIINRILLPLELALLLILSAYLMPYSYVPLISLWLYIAIYGIYISIWTIRYMKKNQLNKHLVYITNDIYEYWLPYIIIISLHIDWKLKIALCIIHGLIFNKGVENMIKTLRVVLKTIFPNQNTSI